MIRTFRQIRNCDGQLLFGRRLARVALRTAVGTELGALPSRRRGREALHLALQRRSSLAL